MNNGNSRRGVLLILGVAAIMLVIGVAIGSVAFPLTKIETTTQLSSITTTVTQNLISQTTIYMNASSSSPAAVTKVGAAEVSSSSGMRLDLLVGPSNGTSGLVVNVDEYNTLSVANNVSSANDWKYPSNDLNPWNPCGAPGPVGFAIFQGYYDLHNYTNALALTLYNTTLPFSCTTMVYPNYYYSFRPQSYVASLIYSGGSVAATTALFPIIKGYWTGGYGNYGGGSATFHVFPQGNYTVLAADEWGKVLLVHFYVSSTGYSSGTSTFTTGSSSVQTASVTHSSIVLTFSSCNTLMNINGTEYCALDVSSDILLGNPGYSYFTSADAIVFNGVTFRTICPSGYEGCPNAVQNATVTIVGIGAINLGLAFQDKTNETVGSVLGDFSGNLTILSNHRNPRAGFLIEYVQPSGTNKGPLFRTFLLVQRQITTTVTQTARQHDNSCRRKLRWRISNEIWTARL